MNDDTYSTCTVLFSFTLFNAFELSDSIRKKSGTDRGERSCINPHVMLHFIFYIQSTVDLLNFNFQGFCVVKYILYSSYMVKHTINISISKMFLVYISFYIISAYE